MIKRLKNLKNKKDKSIKTVDLFSLAERCTALEERISMIESKQESKDDKQKA